MEGDPFYFPRYFYIAVIMQLCSLLSYAPYFLGTQVVNLAYVAVAVLMISVITLADLVLTLYPNIRKRGVVQGVLGKEVSPKIAEGTTLLILDDRQARLTKG